jgi:Prophage CP4-57 regulatory protein (AlpA)
MTVQIQTKSAVSVSEMARMLGFSRSRLYQLIEEGVFPAPVYDISTRRPLFDEDMQTLCLEVRRRNCGINGRPVLFYSARTAMIAQTKPVKKLNANKPEPNRHSDIIDTLKSLGLESVTASQVESAVNRLFPRGTQDRDLGEVIRSVFLEIKRQD